MPDIRKMGFNLRSAGGMHLSRECGLWFWVAWLALTAGLIGALFGEFLLRVPDGIGFYFVEALLGLIAPLGMLIYADQVTIDTYQRTGADLRHRAVAVLLLNRDSVELIRHELRFNLLLTWLKPPRSADVRSQLMTAALWYRALTAPEGAPWWQRYGENMLSTAGAAAALLFSPVLWLLGLEAAGGWMTEERVTAGALLIGCLGLLALGHGLLKSTARRQAIVDFFTTWRVTEEPSHEPAKTDTPPSCAATTENEPH